jgi:hypothetical protein
MKPIKNKEKIVRDLVSTFNDRDVLHEAYKERMKEIFWNFISAYLEYRSDVNSNHLSLEDFINIYVESCFKKAE